jgi:hypothetical protein
VPQLRALLEGASASGREEAAWVAGAAASGELASAIAQAAREAAADFQAERLRTLPGVGAASLAATLTVAEGELGEAWRASLWAAERTGADVSESARAGFDRTMPVGVRRVAARYLAHRALPADLPLFEHGLSDADGEIRAVSARVLSKQAKVLSFLEKVSVPDVGGLASLAVAALQQDGPDALSSPAASTVLPSVVGGKKVEILATVASTPGRDPARLLAIEALGRVGGDLAKATLEKILADKQEDDVVRAAAFRALKRLLRSVPKQYEGDKGGPSLRLVPSSDEDLEEDESEGGDEDEEDDFEDSGDEDEEDDDE